MVESYATELKYAPYVQVRHYLTLADMYTSTISFKIIHLDTVTRIITFTATKYFQQLQFTTWLMVLLGSTTFGACFYTSNNEGFGGILFSFF